MNPIIPFFALLALLASAASQAEELHMAYGLGVNVPHSNSVAEVKMVELSYGAHMGPIARMKLSVGGWVDQHEYVGRTSSGYGFYSLGIRSEPGIFFAEAFWGVGGITATDQLLSSHLQFMGDVMIGVNDLQGRSFGIGYKHISNAGISLPNRGRDAIVLSIGVEL